MQSVLNELSGQIKSVTIDDSLSDDAAVALSHICISTLNAITCHSTEMSDDGREWFDMAERLFAICRRKYARSRAPERRSRMAATMYELSHLPGRMTDMGRFALCIGNLMQTVDDWLKRDSHSKTSRTTEYRMLTCASYLLACADPTDVCDVQAWFDERMAAISDDFSSSLQFGVLPAEESLQRIEAMMWGVGAAELQAVNEIAEATGVLAAQYPAGSDSWLRCMAVALDCENLIRMQLQQHHSA